MPVAQSRAHAYRAFAERDTRAKVGSDAETLEKARHVLGNATIQITRKHYRRKPDIVR